MVPRLLRLHPSTYQRLSRLSKEAERDGAYRVAKRLRAVVLNSEGHTSGPVAYGLDSGIWTSPMIAWVIEEEFGVQYHPGHVRKLLHGWGFSVPRPRRVLARADAAAQDRWHRRIYPTLKKKPARDTGRSSSPTKPASGKIRRSTPPGAA